MDIITQKRVTAWVFILLVALNVFSLGTIWFVQLQKSPETRPPREDAPDTIQRFLNRELNLSEEQKVLFQSTRKKYSELSKDPSRAINQLKVELLRESMTDNPDTAQIALLTASMAGKQRELENLLSEQFHELYLICRPDQQDSFKSLIKEILDMNKPPKPSDRQGEPKPRERQTNR
jgi:hypothetical protein